MTTADEDQQELSIEEYRECTDLMEQIIAKQDKSITVLCESVAIQKEHLQAQHNELAELREFHRKYQGTWTSFFLFLLSESIISTLATVWPFSRLWKPNPLFVNFRGW
jgi:hypothetical protein